MPPSPSERPTRQWRKIVGPVLGAAIPALALWGLYRMLAGTDPRDIASALQALPASRLLAALGCTVASYLVLTLYDRLSLRWLDIAMPWRTSATGTAMAYALGNASFNALLVGAGCRYYAWRGGGITPVQAAQMAAFASLGFWLGYLALGGLLFAIDPLRPSARPAGLLVLLVPLYLLLAWRIPVVRVARWRFSLPPMRLCAAQVGVGMVDMLCISAVLWMLLPTLPALSYSHFLQAFMLAMAAGSASQAPGGLGVFDSAFVLLLPAAPAPQMLAALLAFRLIYYGAPLLAAVLALTVRQARRRRRGPTG